MFRGIGKFVKRHGHQIAAVIAGVGVVVTAVESAKAGIRISKKIERIEEENGEPLAVKEKIVIGANDILIPAAAGAATIAAIATGTFVSERAIVGLAAASAANAARFSEYRANVQTISPGLDESAMRMHAKERVVNYVKQHDISDSDDGMILYHDTHTRQTFRGRPNLNLSAEKRLRDVMMRKGYITENAYRIVMGEDQDPIGGDLYGWDQFSFVKQNDDDPYLKIYEEICTTDDGLEYHVLSVSDEPDADFIGGYSGLSSPFDVR